MGKGIHSTAEQGSVSQSVPIRRLLVAGLVLAWAAGAALAQEPPAAQKPTEPPPAATGPATPAGEENAKVQEQAQRELRWRQEVNASLAALRQELRQMQQQREKEAAKWQEAEESLRSMAERVQAMGLRMRLAREEFGKYQGQSEEARRQQELLQAKVRDVEQRLGTVTERVEADTKTRDQQLDGARKDLQRMGRTLGQLDQRRLKAEGELKADVQKQGEKLGQVQAALTRMLMESDRSTVGSAGYTWGW
jgi:chromosome segregation ATPase